MGIAIPMAVTVTPPELTGVLVWWGVMLATPALFIRRWRRRHGKARRRRRWPSAVRLRRASVSPSSPDGLPSGTGTSGRLAAQPARPGDALRPSAGPLPAHRPPPPRGASQADCIAPGSVSDETLEPLSGYVDFHRRLELAVEELEYRLSRLPADRWRIEPYPLTGERRNTLLLLGECGVFVISTTYAPGHWDDVIAVNRLARKIQRLLPGYSGQVQAGVTAELLLFPAPKEAPKVPIRVGVSNAEPLQNRRQRSVGCLVLVVNVFDPSAASDPLQKTLKLVDKISGHSLIVDLRLPRANGFELLEVLLLGGGLRLPRREDFVEVGHGSYRPSFAEGLSTNSSPSWI